MISYGARRLAHAQAYARKLSPEAWRAIALLAVGVIIGKWVFPLPENDVGLYHRYAQAFLQSGQLPREYPPFAILPMLATLFPNHAGVGLALLMGLLLLASWLLLRLRAGHDTAWRFLIWTTPLTILALTRYDLAPVICATVGMLAATRGRFTLAQLFLAIGALLKVYPLVLIPIVLALQVRRDGLRRALASLALGWAGPLLLLLLLIARQPTQALGWLQIMEHRPMQLESIPASLSWVASLLGLVHTHAGINYYAYSYTSPLDAVTGPALLLIRLAGLLWLYLLIPSRNPAQLATAAVALLIVTNQSLSPQYLLWLIPLAALAALPMLYQAALGAAILLTALDFPVLYFLDTKELAVLHYPTALLTTIALRNLVLVALAVGLIVAPDGLPAPMTQRWRTRASGALIALERQARQAVNRTRQAANGRKPSHSQMSATRREDARAGPVTPQRIAKDDTASGERRLLSAAGACLT